MLALIFFIGFPLDGGQNQSQKASHNKIGPDKSISSIGSEKPEEKSPEEVQQPSTGNQANAEVEVEKREIEDALPSSPENNAEHKCKDEKQVNEVALPGSSLQQAVVEDANEEGTRRFRNCSTMYRDG